MIQTQLKANVFESLIRIWIVTFPRDVVFGSGFPSRSFFSGAGHEFSVQIQVGTEAGWLVLTGLASLLRWKMKTHLSQRFLRFVPALFVGWIPASIRPVVVNPVPIIFYDTRNNKLEACSQERNLNSHY